MSFLCCYWGHPYACILFCLVGLPLDFLSVFSCAPAFYLGNLIAAIYNHHLVPVLQLLCVLRGLGNDKVENCELQEINLLKVCAGAGPGVFAFIESGASGFET